MKNQIKIGSILSYLVIILNILVGLIYTPIMLRIMGQSEYGTYSLISSIIGYLTVLDLGFGNAIIIYTSRYRAKNQKEQQARLNGMFLIIYSIIGIVAGFLGAILYANVDKIFATTMTIQELQKAKAMVIILIFNLVLTFPLSIFGSIITAYEKFIFSKLVNIVRIILMPCIMLPLLYNGYRSVAMTVVTTILNLFCLLLNLIYCLKIIKVTFKFGKFDTKLLKEIFGYSFFIFLAIIVDKINLNIDQFILGSIVGTIEVAIYSVAAQIHTIYVSLSTAINGVLLPKITMLVENKESDEKISDIFVQAGRLQYIIMALITTGFIIFGQEFIKVWAGEGYENSYWTELILMIPALVPLIQNTGIHILQAKNMHKFRTIVYFFIAIANLFISIPLAKKFGSIGSAIGTSLSCLIGQWVIMNIYYYKKANIDIPRFWKNILKMTIPILILFIPALIINSMFFSSNIIIIAVKIIIYTIFYSLLLWFFALNDYEKSLIKKPISQILKLIFKKRRCQMYKVSIIVPVYNTANYLEKCLNSLTNQTLEEIEIILVNDGSTDNSQKIIDKYISKFPNTIKSFYQKNSGQAAARNLGIQHSSGEFLAFVDSDDYVELNAFEKAYNFSVFQNFDIVCFNFYEEKNKIRQKSHYYNVDSPNNDIRYILNETSPCNKIIKKSLFLQNNISFAEDYIYEDLELIPRLVLYTNRIGFLNDYLYTYVIHKNSTMRQKKYNSKLNSIYFVMNSLKNNFKDTKYDKELEFLFIEHLLHGAVLRYLEYEEGINDIYKISSIMKKNFPHWRKNIYYKNKNLKYKIVCELGYYKKIYLLKKILKNRSC